MIALILTMVAAPELVDVEGLHPNFRFDLVYATPNNFAQKVIYPEARCLLRPEVAKKMVAAQQWLEQQHPGYSLLFKDCYRPHSAQFLLWEAVKGTPKTKYLATPNGQGSVHSFGVAVDVTLIHEGVEVDMGTIYDHLGIESEPRYEKRFLAEGVLTQRQLDHRLILRNAMRNNGMRTIPNEWWHFDELPKAEVLRRYPRLDLPFSAVPRQSATKNKAGTASHL